VLWVYGKSNEGLWLFLKFWKRIQCLYGWFSTFSLS
jgi:hypothetical protein